jgi:hypothetical protein
MLSFAKSASESRGRSVRLGWSNPPRVGWAVGPQRGSQPSAPPRRGGSLTGDGWRRRDGWIVSGVGMGVLARWGEVGSGRPPDVSMVQTPDFGDLHDPAHLRPLDRPPVWRVFSSER